MELWKESLSRKTDPDIKARIIGCEYQMTTFNFFFVKKPWAKNILLHR